MLHTVHGVRGDTGGGDEGENGEVANDYCNSDPGQQQLTYPVHYQCLFFHEHP